MIETIRNAWRIPDLRKKILFTFVILVIFRIGSAIPVPFINRELLSQILKAYEDTIWLLRHDVGRRFSQANIFALSVQPYINASIIMQLLSVAIPSLERMVKEGGRPGARSSRP